MVQYQSFPGKPGDSLTLDKLKKLGLPDLAGRTFLDVGCNEGFFCGFAWFQGATRSVGIDQSARFVERARARFPECEFHVSDWNHLPQGTFDVILLASALHYADDQPALIDALVQKLAPDGVLVLELGICSSKKSDWITVKRGIDERVFPTMPKLREVLDDYAWKWMGPSVLQQGDPTPRHVVHISRRRPVAYLLMQPPGYGKTSIATRLFAPAGIPIVSGDQQISQISRSSDAATASLREIIGADYSPYRIDELIRRIFQRDGAEALVRLWVSQGGSGDFVLDGYVPQEHHPLVERLLSELGYLPINFRWDRAGQHPQPASELDARADAFFAELAALETAGQPDAGPAASGGAGFVDRLTLSADRLEIGGWAVDGSGQLPARIGINLLGRTLMVDGFEASSRPDAQRYLGLKHASVGFLLQVDVQGLSALRELQDGFEVFIPRGPTLKLAPRVATLIHRSQAAG